jgi:hypothetical protein
MNETQMLIGSLSNDLLRVASLTQRGSVKGAIRFFKEAKRWSEQLHDKQTKLHDKQTKQYIKNIVNEIRHANVQDLTLESAEKYLMYGILLQNYSLHHQ